MKSSEPVWHLDKDLCLFRVSSSLAEYSNRGPLSWEFSFDKFKAVDGRCLSLFRLNFTLGLAKGC